MSTFDPAGHRHLEPIDEHVVERAARLRQLDLGTRPDAELDEFAQHVARIAGTPNAMVNFISDTQQYLSGLFMASAGVDGAGVAPFSRSVPMGTGYCPHVIARRKALPLDDVFAYPRFAGNDVVDKMGVRAYLGAPVIDRTGTALGTVCVVDSEPRAWGHQGVHMIKQLAAELVELIHRRERDLRLV
ncbi:GAF domain-containing protein [Gandjariella thermophila]|uniref:Histidine kinase n=1 Tax=Gandjariella thermophila TaxID=1931992 RepID=A0A4D4JEV0_9PSEU|nr:GAF domain-containing protein [Gandjariella thermophila]GDY32896.1 histidine kinase [Gandjariella thermophila]